MSTETPAAKMLRLISHQAGISADSIKPTDKFRADLGFDSLDEIELVMAVEEEFGIDIDDQEVENIKTVAEALKYMETAT